MSRAPKYRAFEQLCCIKLIILKTMCITQMDLFCNTHTLIQQTFAGQQPRTTVFCRVAGIIKTREKYDWGDMAVNTSATKVWSV